MPAKDSFFNSIRRHFRDYWIALGERGAFGRLIRKTVEDAVLRERMLKSPNAVLEEAGIRIPPGLRLEVFANTDKIIHLILPPLVKDQPEKGGTP